MGIRCRFMEIRMQTRSKEQFWHFLSIRKSLRLSPYIYNKLTVEKIASGSFEKCVSIAFPWMALIFPWISIGFHWILTDSIDFHRIPLDSTGFHGFPIADGEFRIAYRESRNAYRESRTAYGESRTAYRTR